MAKAKSWFDRPTAGVRNFAQSVSRTQQQFQAECDINQIAARLSRGQPVPMARNVGTYADFASAPDFHEAQELVLRARDQFMSLPAKVRERFGNDPAQLLAFVGDKANYSEAKELGLLAGEVVPPVVEEKKP